MGISPANNSWINYSTPVPLILFISPKPIPIWLWDPCILGGHIMGSVELWDGITYSHGKTNKKIHKMGKIPPKSYCSLRSIQTQSSALGDAIQHGELGIASTGEDAKNSHSLSQTRGLSNIKDQGREHCHKKCFRAMDSKGLDPNSTWNSQLFQVHKLWKHSPGSN